MRSLLLLALLLVGCARQEYTVTCTKKKLIGPDEVRVIERVTHLDKRGWLTSDRHRFQTADGQVIVLQGRWTLEIVPMEAAK